MACGIRLALIIQIAIIITSHLNAYKLNVPKVLLPFHSSKLISFVLEAKSESPDSPEDLCFVWSSSRPDIVSITPIYDKTTKQKREESSNNQECSSKAVVSAVSKHPQRFTSIILAKEIKTDKLIRCDVIVDKINSIRIKHTTTHLYLEDSPEAFTVEALDDEGNTFSSIDGLPFEWTIINDLNEIDSNKTTELEDSRNVLRISKFIDSEYEVSESIRQLESIGLSGNKILIEGLKTGTANVQSKLLDPVYKDELTLKTPLVRLLVVANILLEPSYPVYLLIGSTVKYSVFLIKQTSIEKVNLPSLQYYFESRNTSAASLLDSDQTGSTIVGLSIGSTEIVLIDRNMKDNIQITSDNISKPIVPPPTALVHVVVPDHLVFTIKNWRSSWILEVGRTYEIVIHVYNDKRLQIYPSDNLRIDTVFETGKFRLNFQSLNGSYHIVTGLQKGLTQAQASLIGTVGDNNQIRSFSYIARGQVDIELLDPIDLKPKLLVFALCSAPNQFIINAYEYKILATGGSGSYYWQSRNTTVANVNGQGLVKTTATKIGHTEILVTDTRNIDIQSKSLVYVLEPIDLMIQPCPVETQVGTQLYLNIKMNAILTDDKRTETIIPVNDCSRLLFDVTIQDDKIFRYVSVQSPNTVKTSVSYITDDDSCAVLVLDAIRIGKTAIKVTTITTNEKKQPTLVQLNSNELTIGSYSMLKSYKSHLVLSRGSSLEITLFDGPLLSSLSQSNQLTASFNTADSSQLANYQSKTTILDDKNVEIIPVESGYMPNKYSYIVKCNPSFTNEDTVSTARISISHKQTSNNKCPLSFDFDLKIRCAKPHSVQLNQLMVFNEENSNEIPLPTSLKWKCPIKLSSNQITAHYQRPLFIQVLARDSFNNIFDNFTSHHLDWQIEDKHYIDKSHAGLSSLVAAAAQDENGIYLFNNLNNEYAATSQRVYYQQFDTKSKFGKTKLKVKLHIDHDRQKYLHNDLAINLVSDVSIELEALTIFNHPSNVVTLSLFNGSGYYHAEIETVRVQITDESNQQQANVLKINQINENSIVVSPLVNNGLTYLHIYDYCVAPALLKANIESLNRKPTSNKGVLTTWKPSTSAKIQVSGINSILANYEDDKVEVKKALKIYVQISDSTGNLIKTNYFNLMNLRGKLTTAATGLNNNDSTDQDIGTIEPANADEYEKSNLNKEEREYTAIYKLNALQPGLVNIQFEARADQLLDSLTTDHLIQSQLKEIQIYVPLNVQPKYIELIRGSDYQVLITGGPNSPDASIKYELVDPSNNDHIIDVSSDGIINAVQIGQIRVNVKSIGSVCPGAHTQEASVRCKNENKIQRIYSQDFFIVKVVELHSIQIQVPIKAIKVGNEMPVYLMGNERLLTPLSFGACSKLKYSWKINDQQIGSLHHQLLTFNENDLKSQQTDDLLFENSFVLRFAAQRSGQIKISVKVEFEDKIFSDSIDVLVFDSARFTHFTAEYFMFKYPGIKKQLKLLESSDESDLLIEKYREKSLLITPGTQFQIRTNFDKSASKMSYHLAFNDNIEDLNDEKLNKYCNNNTVQINKEGLITIAKLEQFKLKNLKQCTVTLLVTVSINELKQQQQNQLKKTTGSQAAKSLTSESKHQTLVYELKVKPISYSMLKLNKKQTMSHNRLIKLDKQSLIKNKLKLNSDGLKLQWQLKYYDDLGDSFDVINANTKYTLNRYDLIDFSQINSNVFVYDASATQDQTDKSELNKIKSTGGVISLQSDANENSFLIRTIKPGRLVMELTPFAANLLESKDYLGLTIADLGANDFIRNLDFVKKIEANIGDFMCLNENVSFEEDDSTPKTETKQWSTQNPNVVNLISVENENKHYSSIGLCINEGQALLKKGSLSDSAKIVDVIVRQLDRVKYVSSHSAKFITNVQASALNPESFNLVQFQTGLNQNQNCSDLFEKVSVRIKDLIPFRCSASLFTKTGRRLHYLDRLIKTDIKFVNHNWNCGIWFSSTSNSLLYDLIEANQEQTLSNQKDNDNEPVTIKLSIDSKHTLSDLDNPNEFKTYQLPFVPAFYVQTKQIQLPITRNNFYLQNLRLKNQKEYQLSEHFNLIIYSTEQLHSHYVLSTNCASLIQIKPLTVSRAPLAQANTEFSSSVLKITYDIVTSDELFDLNKYASILQEQNGNLYVQITNSLTQQTERIPIKFQFGAGDLSIEYRQQQQQVKKTQSWSGYLFGWLFDFTPNQITTLAVMITLFLLSVLFILRTKPTPQQTAQQMALNAAAAANIYRGTTRGSGVKEHSSFNPYRYFTSFLDTGSAAYRRDGLNLSGSSLNTSSPSSFSYYSPKSSGSPQRSSQKLSYLGSDQLNTTTPSMFQNQNVPSIYPSIRSPRFSPPGSEQVRLFSVDSDVANTSHFYDSAQGYSRFNDDEY